MTEPLPVFGPSETFGVDGLTPDVVVRVDIALSREHLHTALGMGYAEIAPDPAPDELTDLEIRTEIEGLIAARACVDIDNQMMRDRAYTPSPEQRAVLDALAAAADRAYTPPQAATVRIQDPVYGMGVVTLDTDDEGRITIPEPAWCAGHHGTLVGRREDILHTTAPHAADWEGVSFLPACISWAPFSTHAPTADVWEFPGMDPDSLRGLAEEAIAHAGHLYSLANQLDRIRRETR
ncbi:DUF6907 domain-containing protein [Streptomyces sp. NPDC101249]|uniref:DUF6907 domain-containing protein n=1 Tax=Streptomyces sp. NPDC101249 TaxID=3366140 RepID=UPI003813ABF3